MDDLQIEPKKFYRLKQGGRRWYIIDIRDPWEVEIASINDAHNIPLDDIYNHLDSLPRDRDIVVVCQHGVRSLKTARLLREHGFHAFSILGGVNAYTKEVDPLLPQY